LEKQLGKHQESTPQNITLEFWVTFSVFNKVFLLFPADKAANLVCHMLLKSSVTICIWQCLGSLVIAWDLVCCSSRSKRWS